MFIVGLTGGIGSGKTTVSNLFKELGITVVDTDVIAREVVKPGSQCLYKIEQHFGSTILLDNGNLDRKKLRHIIFSQPEEKHWLESLLHPVIRRQTRLALENSSSPYAILSSPLLLESPDIELTSRIAVVDITPEQQVLRTTIRDETNSAQVEKIIATQLSREEKLAKANDIIDNSGTFENTKQQVLNLHRQYLLMKDNHSMR